MYIGTYYSLTGAAVNKDELILTTTLEESVGLALSKNGNCKVILLSKHWALIDVTETAVIGAKKKPPQARLLLTRKQ